MKTTHPVRRLTPLWSCALLALALPGWASAQTLVHRYSFSDAFGSTNVIDSVGGSAWYGTVLTGGTSALPGPGGSDYTGSQLILTMASEDFVQLPSGILSNYTAVTLDTWVTLGATLPANCFLWGFGDTDPNVLSGGQPSGYNCIFAQPEAGQIVISDKDPSWQGGQATPSIGPLNNGSEIHVTAVYNPPAGYMEIYTNGVLAARSTGLTIPLSSISNVVNYLARSLYWADGYFDSSWDEFRIWNGALNGLQVAGCDVNGPDNPSTNYGTVTSLQLAVPLYQLVQGNLEYASVTAQASGLPPNPVDITYLATYSSSNPNVLTTTNNAIYAVGQGSANIVATYGGISSTQTITVIQPASVLTHRYSFSDSSGSSTAADSVGGSAWNGTLPNSGTFSGTQLYLAASNSQFVQLPAGVISNYPAVTIDAWATFPDALPGNCFFFGFGNTDGGGAGENYIYLQPSAGHIGITGSDPGWQGPESQAGGLGNLSSQTNVHVTAVFNPGAGWIAVYKNGNLVGANTAVTWQLTQVSSVLNYIARSLYTGDSYMDVSMDEYRIFNGALTSQEIAIADGAGADSIPAGVTNGPGSFVSMTLQAPSSLQCLQTAPLKVLANYTGLTNFDLAGNSIFPPAGLSISSSDANVLTYNSVNGRVTAVNPGTAIVTVIYQGITNSASITVTQAPAPTLVHEYTFGDTVGSSTAADSVGGAAWNGTLPNGGTFNGTGQLALTNTSSQYVSLPSGILSNYAAVTIEEWMTLQSNPSYTMYWSFGNTDAGGAGANYLFADYGRLYTAISAVDPGYQAEQGTAGGSALPVGTLLHVATVCNPAAGYIALYTNGVLQSINNNMTDLMSVVGPTNAYIGRSLYTGDPYASQTLDEFRIYNGVLSPNDLKATQALGPNQVLLSTVSLTATASGANNVTLSWPLAAGAYSLQYRTALNSGSWATLSTPAAQIVGSQWQVTVPRTGGAEFFRLAR